MNTLKIIKYLVQKGKWAFLYKEVKRRFFSDEFTICLQCDLRLCSVNSDTDIKLREIERNDIPLLLDPEKAGASWDELKAVLIRLSMADAGINKCYVALTNDGIPCHLTWAIESSENEKLNAFFKGGFPPLKGSEILIEGLFTPPSFRKQGIMYKVLLNLIAQGYANGYSRAIAFVRATNNPSIKAFKRAGFKPFSIRKEKWRFFRRQMTSIPVDDESSDYREILIKNRFLKEIAIL